MKKIAFLGMGAIGTVFASQMVENNYDFQVVCDEKRKEKYIKNGFIVNDKKFDFNYSTPDEYQGTLDIFFISVKYHNLKESLLEVKKLISQDTIIVSLLNGIDSEEIIESELKIGKVVPAYVINIDATKEGNSTSYKLPGKIVFGERTGKMTESTKILEEVFKEAGIDHEFSEAIMDRIWWKFMVNVGVNQMSGLLKATYGHFVSNTFLREQSREVMLEVVSIAKLKDIKISEKDIDVVLGMYKDFAYDGKTSMLQDVMENRKTEVEMFAGKICEMGEQLKVPTPYNHMIYNMYKAMEAIKNI
jgi:2-dehydropantoate 2-reductase